MGMKPKAIHVSASAMLVALESATLTRMQQAAAVFVPPTNSRKYECLVPGCVRPAYAKGLCNAHYIRGRKGLPLDAPVRARKRDGVCDKCGGELYQRSDDNEETVSNRVRVYVEETSPLVDYYTTKAIILNLDGEKAIDAVFEDICKALGSK